MPGKGKRGKIKHPQSKKGKAKLRQVAPAAPMATAPAATAAPSAPAATARPLSRPASSAKGADVMADAVRYPHFVPELKMIGVLAVIIVVVLVVLSIVLS
jgi:hypothetical protein